jgi:sugar porter (SP) family MFS transporter
MVSVENTPPPIDTEFMALSTPTASMPLKSPFSSAIDKEVLFESPRVLKPKWILYTSVLVVLLQPLQYGWSTSQLNLSTYNKEADCDARPVADRTCVVFPGHSKMQWTFVINAWFVGGMVGSLLSGHFSDKFGRKCVLTWNCGFIVAGAVVQAASTGVWMLVAGRAIAGIASGCATSVVNGFINEISPPHLRNTLGVGFQISITMGILLVSITFFFANTGSGWRYAAGFPIVLAAIFLLAAPFAVVESPTWLLLQGRVQDAEKELARLFGEEHVGTAIAWIKSSNNDDPEAPSAGGEDPVETMVKSGAGTFSILRSPHLRRQLAGALGIAIAQQLSGINVVFLYSSDMFTSAGISDDRVGTVIIDVVNVLPTLVAGSLAIRFGNRTMLLTGMISMFVCAIGMTVSLLVDVAALSIVFTALYVIGFEISLGPLGWVIIGDLFPDSVRATASSLCLCANWIATLIIGVAYPYVADALGDLSFLPFVVTLFLFTAFVFWVVPETSGKTNEEIQAGFRAILELKRRV